MCSIFLCKWNENWCLLHTTIETSEISIIPVNVRQIIPKYHLHFSLYAITTTGFLPSSCSNGFTSFHSSRSEYGIHSLVISSSELSLILFFVLFIWHKRKSTHTRNQNQSNPVEVIEENLFFWYIRLISIQRTKGNKIW